MTERTSPNPAESVAECRCEELLEHLYEFLDAEISESEGVRLRRHVQDCPTCREVTDVETKVRVLLRRSCTEVAPDTLRMRVVTQLSVLRREVR